MSRDREPASAEDAPTLLDVQDELSSIRNMVEIGLMAAEGMGSKPFCELLAHVSVRLGSATMSIEQYREILTPGA